MIRAVIRRAAQALTRGGFGLLAAAWLALALVLNLPFYAGSSGDRLAWRMEHGCLTVKASDLNRPKDFWVSFNTEGLRWTPEGHFHDRGNWTLTLPLWIPLALCLAWAARTATRSSLPPANRSG